MQPIYKSTVVFPKVLPRMKCFKDLTPVSEINKNYRINLTNKYSKSYLVSTNGSIHFDQHHHENMRVTWKNIYCIKPMTQSQINMEHECIDEFLEGVTILLTMPKFDIREVALRRIICSKADEGHHIVNFIRHNLTNYDHIRKHKAYLFTQKSYFAVKLKLKCLNKMLEKFPYAQDIQVQINTSIERLNNILNLEINDRFYYKIDQGWRGIS